MRDKTLISDVGGTYLDVSFELAFQEWARRGGSELAHIRRGFAFDQEFAHFEVNKLTPQQYFQHLRRTLNIQLGDSDMAAGWNSIFIGINGPMRALFQELRRKGIRIVGVTNTNLVHQRFWSEKYCEDIAIFDALYTSVNVGMRKPEPELFDYILVNERLRKDMVVFFDDLPETVAKAREYGLDSYVYIELPLMIADMRRAGFSF